MPRLRLCLGLILSLGTGATLHAGDKPLREIIDREIRAAWQAKKLLGEAEKA